MKEVRGHHSYTDDTVTLIINGSSYNKLHVFLEKRRDYLQKMVDILEDTALKAEHQASLSEVQELIQTFDVI